MRGWGCLVPGTMTQLPVPGDQLILLGLPVYTFGGLANAGQPGTAGQPDATRCRTLHVFP